MMVPNKVGWGIGPVGIWNTNTSCLSWLLNFVNRNWISVMPKTMPKSDSTYFKRKYCIVTLFPNICVVRLKAWLHFFCVNCKTWWVWRKRASCRCQPVYPWPHLPWWRSCMCAGRCSRSLWRGSAGRSAAPTAVPHSHNGSGGPCRSWVSCWSKCQHHLYGGAHRIWWIHTHIRTQTRNSMWVTAGQLRTKILLKAAERKQGQADKGRNNNKTIK